MKSYAKTSDFLSLSESCEQLVRWGFTEKEAQSDIFAALRDGKLRTREWAWDKDIDRFVVSPDFQVRDRGFINSEWTTLVLEDIDWEQSSVKDLWRPPYGDFRWDSPAGDWSAASVYRLRRENGRRSSGGSKVVTTPTALQLIGAKNGPKLGIPENAEIGVKPFQVVANWLLGRTKGSAISS